MLKNFKSSKKAHAAVLTAMFLIMLLFNVLTEKIADDFTYCFSFATGEKIGSLGELVDSMIMHGKILNGRYFAHAIVQVLLLMPDIIFDLINSAVFVIILYSVYLICNRGNKTNNFFLIGIFGFIWLFEHNFGQVNLWLDGSCNYQFALLFGLIFILPFMNSFMRGKKLNPLLLLPHMILSLWFGGYIEPVSVGFVCAASLFTLGDFIYNKNRRALLFIPSIISSLLGFALMVLAPSHAEKKLTTFSFIDLLTAFGMSLLMLLSILPITVIYVILARRAKNEGIDKRILFTAHILGIGVLASNLVLIFASYFVLRCTICFIFMSVFATALLYGNVKNHDFGFRGKVCYKVFTAALSLAILVGLTDNVITYTVIKENESIIAEATENGEDKVVLKIPRPFTKYNAVKGLIYLDPENSRGWPNADMAKYYGLSEIVGTK